ncbi:MAG: hypothetical protein WDA21_00305 [Bacilli bacterium]
MKVIIRYDRMLLKGEYIMKSLFINNVFEEMFDDLRYIKLILFIKK